MILKIKINNIINLWQIILVIPSIFALNHKYYYSKNKNTCNIENVCTQEYNKNELIDYHLNEKKDSIKINKFCKKCLRKKKERDNYCKKCPVMEILNSLNILLPEETLDEIIYNNKSISRFGDGELGIIFGSRIGFQKFDKNMSKRLIDILNSNEKGLLIGLENSLKYSYLNILKDWVANYWIHWIKRNKTKLINLLDLSKQYGSTKISRFYMDYKENTIDVPKYLKQLRMIWNKKDIIIIEGEKTRLGVGNDLFNNVNSLQRIICPSENSFDVYNKIYNEAIKIDKSKLFLISLGPTATILAFDLYKNGYQAIDIGHVDIEYEWYLRNATTKIKINNKYINEITYGNINITDVTDRSYYDQIIVKIQNE
ncbi:DUF1792-domain-containing protein [Neocallimastix lanati (nom. inval.)]|nr:DUF1792-domain-containing protein [Neocallimastix sp. JGI-2020a]